MSGFSKFFSFFILLVTLIASPSVFALVIGSLSHESGDVFVSDSLNNVEWMHFSEAGFDGSRSSLEAKFADSNSDLFGFHIASAVEAVNFAAAAFGISPNTSSMSQSFSGNDGILFTAVMGDAYIGNTNNIWLHESGGSGAVDFSIISEVGDSTIYTHNYYRGTDTWTNMTYLAVRDISDAVPADEVGMAGVNNIDPVIIPEPSVLALMGLGLIVIFGVKQRNV